MCRLNGMAGNLMLPVSSISQTRSHRFRPSLLVSASEGVHKLHNCSSPCTTLLVASRILGLLWLLPRWRHLTHKPSLPPFLTGKAFVEKLKFKMRAGKTWSAERAVTTVEAGKLQAYKKARGVAKRWLEEPKACESCSSPVVVSCQ